VSQPDTEERTRALRGALARRLDDDGVLRSRAWRAAVEDTPRHVFVPEFFRQVRGEWVAVRAGDDGYDEGVYGDVALTTQVIDGRPTSSSSQPSLMVEMLEGLGVEDGQRVGEVATGSGYNSGLLCHRVGDRNVVTMEVDAELARLAKARLRACGYEPAVLVGDARAGFPVREPLDRLVVTCGFDRFPYGLARAVRPGGVVVCPLGSGNARLEVRRDGVLEGHFLTGGSYFMRARDAGDTGRVPYPHPPGPAVERTAATDPAALRDEGSRFVQSLALGEFEDATELDADANPTGYRVWARDGSLAHVVGARVRQSGPRRLWDALEAAHIWYEAHGRPSRHRFGATVTAEAQHYWLDEPGNTVAGAAG
jgi:protein-L-isoaspartate O-methyltransferase